MLSFIYDFLFNNSEFFFFLISRYDITLIVKFVSVRLKLELEAFVVHVEQR